jgi:hypothetical protein
LNRYFISGIVALLIPLFPTALAQKKAPQVPGLYQTFEQFIYFSGENFEKKLKKLKKKPDSLNRLKDVDKVDLDPDFLNHILFHTPTRYAMLAQKDRCSFYDLVLAGLVRDHEGPIKYLVIRYTPKKGKPRRSFVYLDMFMEKIGLQQCPKARKFQSYFTLKNFPKTIKTINLQTPNSLDHCYEVHKNFMNDYKTPYLCSIYEKIDRLQNIDLEIRRTPKKNFKKIGILKTEKRNGEKYAKLVNDNALEYLSSLCNYIDKPKMFCTDFFQTNFWGKIMKGDVNKKYVEAFCQSLLDRKELSDMSINTCIRKMNRNSGLCHYANKYYPALVPKPNCKNISKALNYSRLYAAYNDCPAKTGNEAIVNMNRILQHIAPTADQKGSFCSLSATDRFVKFNEKYDGRAWQVKLCYEDKINEKEVCYPSLTGNVGDSELSIGKVVSQILIKTKAAPTNLKCNVVSKDQYNPQRLKYKTGCWVVYDAKFCNAISCPNKIIWKEREVTHIKQKQIVEFDYFPNSFKFEKFSQVALLKDNLNITHKKVINITMLKNIFKKHPRTIIHGMGCSEDLLPSFFKKEAFNQCTPLPFIVDGYIEDEGYLSLVVRTALDDLHAPRIISWTQIFSATKSYQLHHPLNTWGLYAIY